VCDNIKNLHDPGAYRSRVEYEDQLLNSRSSIFLVVNGLGAVAVGLAPAVAAKLAITIVVVLINLLWVICVYQSFRFIRALSMRYRDLVPEDPIETLREETLGPRYWIRPTNILGIYIPVLVLVSWLLALYMLLV